MSWWLALLVSHCLHASSARLVDPHVLRAPIVSNDRLAVLKHLWRLGVRGPLFEVKASGDLDDGHYLVVENWDVIKPLARPGVTLLWDRKLLRKIQSEAANGLTVVVHSRIPAGAFAINTDNTFYGLVAPVVERLSHGPYVVINGYTTLYLFEHELAHHADHASGFAEATWTEVQRDMKSMLRPGQELEPIWFFMAEARAIEREFRALEDETRPFEYQGTRASSESTAISRVNGPAFRNRRLVRMSRTWNEDYARALDGYSPDLRAAAREFFSRTISDFELRFDANDRLRPPCERGLVKR